MNVTRLRLAVVPAALAALVLAGCQDEAPTAAPPTSAASPTSQAPAGGETSPSPTESQTSSTTAAEPSPSASESSTSAAAPSSDGASGVKCESSSSSSILRAGLEAKPLGKQTKSGLGFDKSTSIDITVSKPTIDTSSTDSYFPGDGMVVAIFPVTIKVTAGDYYIPTPSSFGVVDVDDNICDRDYSTVVPRSKQIQIETLRTGDSTSGQLGFAVPRGTDLSKYAVVFKAEGGGKADLAWKAS